MPGPISTTSDPPPATRGQGWYSYDLGAWHIVVLNSNCFAVGGCGNASPQLAWLRADLAAHPSAHVLAYWHHPRFSSGVHGPSLVGQRFWEALYAAGADIVLNGHDHDYERFAPQDPWARPDPTYGIREFVVGTGGTALRTRSASADNSQVFASAHGVLELTLRADGYDWRFVPVAGTSFTDAGSGTPHGPPPARTRSSFVVGSDSWVDQAAPHTTHGSSSVLRVDGDHGGGADYRSYLKFRAVGLSGTVVRAAIRLWVTDRQPRWPGGLADVDELVGQDADLGEPPRAHRIDAQRCGADAERRLGRLRRDPGRERRRPLRIPPPLDLGRRADRVVGARCASAAADRRDGALAGRGRLERRDRAGRATLDPIADAAQHPLLEREVERLDQGGIEEVGGG